MKFQTTAFIADLLNSFCEEVDVVAFVKVMQQRSTGEMANSITCFRADNFCLQSETIIKTGQYFHKLCTNEKGSSFSD